MSRAVLIGFVAIALSHFASLAFAVTPIVYLVADDAVGSSSFNVAGNWSNGFPPSAGFAYSNLNSATPTQGSALRTPASSGDFTFAGDSLTIGGVASFPSLVDEAFRFKGLGGSVASPNVITINNLTLNPYAYIHHASGPSDYFALAGTLHVNGGDIVVQGPTYIQSLVSGSGTLGIGSPSNNQAVRTVHFTNGANTFTGNIVLNNSSPDNFATPAASRFALDSTGVLNFVIGANGVSNFITGVTTPANSIATYNGAFTFDLSGASSGFNDSWAVATVPSQTFGATFTVNGFTNVGIGRWNAAAHGAVYQFSQATGRLTVVAVPEPAGVILIGIAGVAMAARRRRSC